MFLYNEISKFVIKHKDENIAIFVDMDGVIADYRFGEGENIKNNVEGTYINKRPIYSTINNLKYIAEKTNLTLYILSSCLYDEQVKEKNEWLDKNAIHFKEENRFYVLPKDFDGRKSMKVDKLISIMNDRKIDISIFIDDTHDILFESIKRLADQVLPFHVSTLID